MIKAIYEASCDDTNPSNYRGITLSSCHGKLFSNLINHRLTLFVDNYNIIGPEQEGFRAGFPTTDHVFAIKTLTYIIINIRKICCGFVNYSKAFDSISRTKLWHKLLESNISGKICSLVHNMYKTATSCVTSDGRISDTCPCLVGERQGEKLSPFLFSIYLGDLRLFYKMRTRG